MKKIGLTKSYRKSSPIIIKKDSSKLESAYIKKAINNSEIFKEAGQSFEGLGTSGKSLKRRLANIFSCEKNKKEAIEYVRNYELKNRSFSRSQISNDSTNKNDISNNEISSQNHCKTEISNYNTKYNKNNISENINKNNYDSQIPLRHNNSNSNMKIINIDTFDAYYNKYNSFTGFVLKQYKKGFEVNNLIINSNDDIYNINSALQIYQFKINNYLLQLIDTLKNNHSSNVFDKDYIISNEIQLKYNYVKNNIYKSNLLKRSFDELPFKSSFKYIRKCNCQQFTIKSDYNIKQNIPLNKVKQNIYSTKSKSLYYKTEKIQLQYDSKYKIKYNKTNKINMRVVTLNCIGSKRNISTKKKYDNKKKSDFLNLIVSSPVIKVFYDSSKNKVLNKRMLLRNKSSIKKYSIDNCIQISCSNNNKYNIVSKKQILYPKNRNNIHKKQLSYFKTQNNLNKDLDATNKSTFKNKRKKDYDKSHAHYK